MHFIYKQEVISFNIDRARRLTAAMLLKRRFSVGYRNARAKAENSSNSGEAYHFESLARQYAWDLFTLQRQGVIAAVQQANHFATANNNNNNGSSSKTRPSCVSVPYPAGVIYCEEDRDKERAELELLQKRYVKLVDLVHRLAPNKNPTFRAWNPSHIKEMDEEVAQTEQKLIDAITNYQKQDCSGS